MQPRRFPVGPEPQSDDDEGPYQFILEGHRVSNKEPWEELFTVLPALPPLSLSNLTSAAVLDGDEVKWNNVAVTRFLRQIIVPADERRWDALMFDKDRVVDPNRLGDVMLDVTGEKARLPISPRPTSPSGSRNGSTGSEADSSSEDSPAT